MKEYEFNIKGWGIVKIEAPTKAIATKKAKDFIPKILYLHVKKPAFDVMVTGEKEVEFRKGSQWLRSRLFDKEGTPKHFDLVKFTNGYGYHRPYFICKFKGIEECLQPLEPRAYSNGLKVWGITKGDFIIILGNITKKGNL